MSNENKTHFRKAFNSPYLSSSDIVEPTILTIARVTLEKDKTKKTKDEFNTAYFVEKEIRKGEPLKPMILNATNSKAMFKLTGLPFIDDWINVAITIYVDNNVRFGNQTMDGLRISPQAPQRQQFVRPGTPAWENAKNAFIRDGNLNSVLSKRSMTEEDQARLILECTNTETGEVSGRA